MGSKRQHDKAIPPWILAAVVCLSVVGAVLILPGNRRMLERQLRDKKSEQALKTLSTISPEERETDPAFFALTELRLKRETLMKSGKAAIRERITAAARTCRAFNFAPEFLKELMALIPLLDSPEEIEDLIAPSLRDAPFEVQRRFESALVAKALETGSAARAATLYASFWKKYPDETTTRELAGLQQQSNQPRKALQTIASFTQDHPGARTNAALLRLKIDLLRADDRAKEAFDTLQSFRNQGDEISKEALFDLWVALALEANRGVEVLPELVRRAGKSADEEVWKRVAEVAVSAEQLPVAVNAYQRIRQLNPQTKGIAFKLGQVNEWSNLPDTAFDYYLGALKEGDSRAVSRLLALNPGLARDGDLVEALEAAPAQVEVNGIALQLARLELQTGHVTEAKAHYGALIQAQPENYELLREYGNLLLALFDYDEAEAVVQRETQLRPNDPGPQKDLAEINIRLGRYEKAFETYEKLLAGGKNDDLLETFVTLAESLGHLEAVTASLRQKMSSAAKIPAHDFERLAYFESLGGKTNNYIEVLQKGMAAHPEETGLRTRLAYALADAQRFDQAAAILPMHAELRSSPDIAVLYLSVLIRAQKLKDADEFLKSGLKNDLLENPAVVPMRAQVAEGLNRLPEALRIFERLHSEHPDSAYYGLNCARLLAAVGRSREAGKILAPYLGDPNPAIIQLAAQIYAAGHDYKTAELWQRRLLATNPQELPQAWGFLGDILLSRGDKILARRAYLRGVQEMVRESAKPKP